MAASRRWRPRRALLQLLLACPLAASEAQPRAPALRSPEVAGAVSGCLDWLAEVRQRCSDEPSELVRAAGLAGAGAAACYWGLPAAAQRVSASARGLKFWSLALPIYVEYRVMERALRGADEGESRDRWKALHEKHAGSLLDMCLDLRGFYVKIGQVCSTRRDMFPGPWISALEQLQGEHPELLARTTGEVEGIIRKGLGRRAEELVELSGTALGAAATGQVHRARLRDGREVVVKVQYPDAERLYRLDFANTRLFCALLQPEHLPYLTELEAQFKTEFDYRREARDLEEISRRFAPGSGNPYSDRVRIPAPVMELAAKNVVVMEYLPGQTLLSYARRRKRELEDSSFLSYLWHGFWLRRELRAHLRLLIGVQGHQIFVDGVFNGDPHPGNILLMPGGRLGLIDYGNVKRLTATQQVKVGRLYVALAGGRRDEVAAAAEEVGFRTRAGDRECLFRFARLWFDRDDDASLVLPDGSRAPNIQLYMERLNAIDPLIGTPEGFLMVARSSFLLRGLGTHFGVRLHMGAEWKALAEQAVRRGSSAPGLRGP